MLILYEIVYHFCCFIDVKNFICALFFFYKEDFWFTNVLLRRIIYILFGEEDYLQYFVSFWLYS